LRLYRILKHINSDNIISLLVLLAGISICLALFFTTISKEQDQARLHFKLLAEETTSSIVNSITENSTTVAAVASYFNASNNVDRQGFSVFVRPFLNRNKSIQALQWIPHVSIKDRKRYEESARRDGLSDFHFMEWEKPHVLRIAGIRKDYFVVYYNEPLIPNRGVTGLDDGSEPVRYRALLDTAENASETYSPPITLLQSKAEQKGYLVYHPVYDQTIIPATPEMRLKHLKGFATGVFLMDKVLQSALGNRHTGSIHLEVIDTTNYKQEQSFGSIGIKGNENIQVSYDRFYSFGNRRWRFHAVPGISYSMPSHISAWTRLVLGLALVCVIFVFLIYRTIAVRMLREKEERFNQLTEQSRTIIWDVNADGLYTYFSHVSEIVLGYRAEEMVGKKYFYDIHPEDGREAFKHAAFKVFARKEPFRDLENAILTKDGRIVWVSTNGMPIIGNDGSLLGYRGSDTDITERKQAEEALQTERNNLAAIFASSPVGMVLMDEDTTIVDANAVVAEMVSRNLSEIIHQRFGSGLGCMHSIKSEKGCGSTYACSECLMRQGITQVLDSGESMHEDETQLALILNGQEHHPWLRISAEPVTINGHKHVVVAIDDITDRKRAEETILDGERRYRLLWESASEGFALHELVKDSDGFPLNYRILDVNPVFESITGMAAKDIIGKLGSEAYGTTTPPNLDIYARVATTGIAESFETSFGPSNLHLEVSVFSPSPGQFATAFSDISERKAHEAMLNYQSTHDALTNLPNRLYFERHVTEILQDNAGRKSRSMGVLFLDLDNFKMVNDTMGHKAGDELLKESATRLSQCLRSGDILARIGGDEFTILLHDIWAKDDAAIVAQRILKTIAQPFEIAGCKMVIGVSIGVSVYPDNAVDVDGLLRSADAAMYKAKELGRNNCQFFSDEINQANQNRAEMERDLRQALEQDELKVYYQPITDIRTMQIIGAEALLRWDHPEQGMISPGLFVPLAEETGLIIPMGRMVLETACKQGKAWHDAGYQNFEISVNVSPAQLSDIGFISEVHGALSDSGLPPNCLKLEVTETVLAKNDNDEVDLLSILKSLGVSICLDDFGIGYSSLSRLNKLPIVHMKIDGYFIRNIAYSEKDRAMTESIIVMAHNLGIEVTAEWIEDEDQMEIIKSLNCDYAQGYLVSPALSAGNFSNFLKAWTTRQQSINAA